MKTKLLLIGAILVAVTGSAYLFREVRVGLAWLAIAAIYWPGFRFCCVCAAEEYEAWVRAQHEFAVNHPLLTLCGVRYGDKPWFWEFLAFWWSAIAVGAAVFAMLNLP